LKPLLGGSVGEIALHFIRQFPAEKATETQSKTESAAEKTVAPVTDKTSTWSQLGKSQPTIRFKLEPKKQPETKRATVESPTFTKPKVSI
jgi:hypothetical protein